MAMTVEWQGHKIDFTSSISPKYLMLAGESALKVDNREVGRTGGFHFRERTGGNFLHENKPVAIELELRGGFSKINYTLRVAGEPVSRGKLNLQGAGWACLLWALIGLLLGALGTIIIQNLI